MRKISLDVNKLRVESFDTSEVDTKERGTVHGHATERTNCATFCRTECGAYCPSGPAPTCEMSVAYTDGYASCVCGPPDLW